MGKLDGKIALITGGNSGIGLATAKRFVKEGAFVVITGRTQSKLDEAVKQVGTNVAGVQGDVANLADLDRLLKPSRNRKVSWTLFLPTPVLPNTRRWEPSRKNILTASSAAM